MDGYAPAEFGSVPCSSKSRSWHASGHWVAVLDRTLEGTADLSVRVYHNIGGTASSAIFTGQSPRRALEPLSRCGNRHDRDTGHHRRSGQRCISVLVCFRHECVVSSPSPNHLHIDRLRRDGQNEATWSSRRERVHRRTSAVDRSRGSGTL